VVAERCFRFSLKEKEGKRWSVGAGMLARALYARGKFGDAKVWARRCVEGCEGDVQGGLDAMWLLARILEAQGRWRDALEVYGYVAERATNELGKGHRDTIEYWEECIRVYNPLHNLDIENGRP
jgi:tetratricopeptide (TPR) repeat protein